MLDGAHRLGRCIRDKTPSRLLGGSKDSASLVPPQRAHAAKLRKWVGCMPFARHQSWPHASTRMCSKRLGGRPHLFRQAACLGARTSRYKRPCPLCTDCCARCKNEQQAQACRSHPRAGDAPTALEHDTNGRATQRTPQQEQQTRPGEFYRVCGAFDQFPTNLAESAASSINC